MPAPEELKQKLNQEELDALEEFLATKKTLTPAVLESLYEFCRRAKEARPEAVLYCTGAKVCFRTLLTKKGQAFGLQPSRIAYRYDSDYFPRFDGAPKSVEGLLCHYYVFWVVFENCDHGDVTGQDFFEKAVQAGIDAYDQCLEYIKSKKKQEIVFGWRELRKQLIFPQPEKLLSIQPKLTASYNSHQNKMV